MKVVFVLALAIVTACAADTRKPSAQTEPDGGMIEEEPMPDAPMMMEEMATFTSYVKDLIVTNTTSFAAPRPASEWAALPDPDGDTNNVTAYSSLF